MNTLKKLPSELNPESLNEIAGGKHGTKTTGKTKLKVRADKLSLIVNRAGHT